MDRHGMMRTVYAGVVLLSVLLELCSGCSPSEFPCGSGECVKISSRCDGVHHCTDGSDEFLCSSERPTTSTRSSVPCTDGHYPCRNGKCIYPGWRCDGHDDCGDGSDERGCTSKKSSIMSMGSIIGLSIAVAGLFLIVIGIAIMLTCIRRKSLEHAREMHRQRRFVPYNGFPYSVSGGAMMGREPPPRYMSQSDLAALPNMSVLPEHLGSLSMQPPPYYSSNPDLSSSSYCPPILEAPPLYSSRQNVSVPGPGDESSSCPPDSAQASVTTGHLYTSASGGLLQQAESGLGRLPHHGSKEDGFYDSKQLGGKRERERDIPEEEKVTGDSQRAQIPAHLIMAPEVKDQQGTRLTDQIVDIDASLKTSPVRSRHGLGLHSVSSPVLTSIGTPLQVARRKHAKNRPKPSQSSSNVTVGGTSQSLSSLADSDDPTYRSNSFSLAVAPSMDPRDRVVSDPNRPGPPGPVSSSRYSDPDHSDLTFVGKSTPKVTDCHHRHGQCEDHSSTDTSHHTTPSDLGLSHQRNISKSLSHLSSGGAVGRCGSFSSVASWDC